MNVNVTVYSSLSKSHPDLINKQIELNDLRNIRELVDELEIDSEKIGLIFINNSWADMKSDIKNGDEIQFFPHLGGG